jgi:hypothetical protein
LRASGRRRGSSAGGARECTGGGATSGGATDGGATVTGGCAWAADSGGAVADVGRWRRGGGGEGEGEQTAEKRK